MLEEQMQPPAGKAFPPSIPFSLLLFDLLMQQCSLIYATDATFPTEFPLRLSLFYF